MSKFTFICFVVFAMAGACQWALAGAALNITNGPIIPDPPNNWTGPPIDPHGTQGVWFRNTGTNGAETARPYEFYDNIPGSGGGANSYLSIQGYATNVVYDPGSGGIVSFDISAVITNDTLSAGPPWQTTNNSHYENFYQTIQYKGTMLDTKLTSSFAVDIWKLMAWDPMQTKRTQNPYSDLKPYINALNYDESAWYCWTPDNTAGKTPYGDFLVPTWDFGDIEPGQSVGRLLHFDIRDAMGYSVVLTNTDSRWTVIRESADYGEDILFNRTRSLKISDWIENLLTDTGVAYPYSGSVHSSDVSVFFTPIPEPGSIAMLSDLGIMLGLSYLWRKNRAVRR